MPSFSSFLKSSRRAGGQENGSSGNGNAATLQRRLSKRDFLRKLISPRSTRPESQADRRNEEPATVRQEAPVLNSNKPLPPPPRTGDGDEAKTPAQEAPVKLDRIITPISLPDVHKLFSGAPQFFVRSEGFYTGPPKPSVAFPWDTELQVRDLSDHCQIEDEAWATVTALPHITRHLDNEKNPVKIRGCFIPRCHERPNMLSMQGLERGTIGFSAALEMSVADALYEQAEEPTSPQPVSLTERRNDFLNTKRQGLRPLAEADVITRLLDLGALYHQSPPHSRKKSPVDLYTELFTLILFPPSRVKDSNNPYSLHVQIEALVDVLATPSIWVDFSSVEWRIRVGQVLWGPPLNSNEESEPTSAVEANDSGLPHTQRSWLLLQILLSCELLLRLDLVTKEAGHGQNVITAHEVHQFEEYATQGVRWSLILARLWLENIRIEVIKPTITNEATPATGWLSAFTGTVTTSPQRTDPDGIPLTEFGGRHQERQVLGLLHFARKIHWPHVERLAAKLSSTPGFFAITTMNTPAVGTPSTMSTQQSSYFSSPARSNLKRGLLKQKQSRSALMQSSGWLSRSFISGLIFPGECLNHFLISTLLENDETAVARLGDEANLYGGFIYSSSSYWSTACIVGRVLAAGKGASECMGWLSSDVVPQEMRDGWVNIQVEEALHDEENNSPEKARIWKKKDVERDGYVLGDGDTSTALPGDFRLPFDDIRDNDNLEVTLKSLTLSTALQSLQNTPQGEIPTPMTKTIEGPAIKSYAASVSFAVSSTAGGVRNMTYDLLHDVHFVTAHPCIPSQHAKNILDSPTNQSFRITSPQTPSDPKKLGPHELFAGHPLHKSFLYKRVVLSQLLDHPRGATKIPHPLATLHTPSNEVFVVDCNEPNPPSSTTSVAHEVTTGATARKRRWGSDLEMLTRAWCAQMGYNALISRRGRNCIACSIREARALGWKIVLRFG